MSPADPAFPANPVFPANPGLARHGTTIFTVMSALALEHGAVNLGQGFPDEDGPELVRRRAAEAILEGPNQYPPMRGVPELRRAVAEHERRRYDLRADWQSEVLVTSGATEALAASILGLLQPGDEVVLLEPLYDSYLPMVERAGAVARLVRLEPPDWSLPQDALAAAFGPRTRLLILNSPLNPAGKVFDRDELSFLAGLLRAHDAFAVCDEVYEHLVFDGRAHVPLATLPGMRERCVRIGSAGKTFSLTGWKVGWATGPAPLIDAVARAHQFLTFTTPPGLQLAVAEGLGLPDTWFDEIARGLQRKRDRLAAGLSAAGFGVLPTAGTFFMIASYDREAAGDASDEAFCRRLTIERGVATIPVGAFYRADSQAEAPRGYVRFCFCKRDEVLDEAITRLTRPTSSV